MKFLGKIVSCSGDAKTDYQSRRVKIEAKREILLRYDSDAALVCCKYFSPVRDSASGPSLHRASRIVAQRMERVKEIQARLLMAIMLHRF